MLSREAREDRGVLRHQRDVRAQLADRLRESHAVEGHAARRRIVEAQDQVEDRALAGARRADDRDLLAGRDRNDTPSSATRSGRVG